MIKKKYSWSKVIGQNWEAMLRSTSTYKPRLYHCIVRWEAPQEGMMKFNTDGASRGNPGSSAYGFCLRNNHGDLIYAVAENIGITTNMEAELRAILEGIKYCVAKKVEKLIVESDSLLIVKIIKEVWKVPWELADYFDDLKREMTKIEVTIQHIYREGNKLADYLANLAINASEMKTFRSFEQLPSMGRKIMNMEKSQIPALRVRTRKIFQ
ncbi:hypothetical protein KY290_001074 [Solanum tuberosum]|uniref:RNase H type-1 domain-containing protein n=1 Tax=Solanum tuberosum TaxID=4113 RepID=A0ABQ7WL29_SOLTU|nr:hypothetical protein KY290_001074 [Solanum tuberosum]